MSGLADMEYLSTEGFAWRCSREWAEEVENALKNGLDNLADSVDDIAADDDVITPSGVPFCGCSDCVIREVLFLVIPRVLNGVADGVVERVTPSPHLAS